MNRSRDLEDEIAAIARRHREEEEHESYLETMRTMAEIFDISKKYAAFDRPLTPWDRVRLRIKRRIRNLKKRK